MYKGNHSQYRKDDILSPDPKITDYMEQRVKQINQMVLHDYKSGHEQQDTQNILKVKKPQRMFKNLSQASYKVTKSFNASTTSEATFSS